MDSAAADPLEPTLVSGAGTLRADGHTARGSLSRVQSALRRLAAWSFRNAFKTPPMSAIPMNR